MCVRPVRSGLRFNCMSFGYTYLPIEPLQIAYKSVYPSSWLPLPTAGPIHSSPFSPTSEYLFQHRLWAFAFFFLVSHAINFARYVARVRCIACAPCLPPPASRLLLPSVLVSVTLASRSQKPSARNEPIASCLSWLLEKFYAHIFLVLFHVVVVVVVSIKKTMMMCVWAWVCVRYLQNGGTATPLVWQDNPSVQGTWLVCQMNAKQKQTK